MVGFASIGVPIVSPLQLQLVLGWMKDWTGIRDPDAIRERRSYLRARNPGEIAHIANRVRDAREGRLSLARELAWPIYDELHMVSNVFVTSNPLDLLDIVDTDGDDKLLVQQRFEALCLSDLAVAMHELEQRDSMDRVEHDLHAMIQFLERRIFSGETRELDIYTYHDPDDMYRVRQTSYDAPATHAALVERKHNSRCRITRDGVVTRFDVRPKDRFRTVIKLLKQTMSPKPGHDPFVARDRCGFKFVVKGVADASALAKELEWVLSASGADVRDGGDNLTKETGAPADVTNARSSPKYLKKQFDVLWHGRWYEFQIVVFSGYYSALYALDEENHVIYKLRQGVKDVLPVLYPGHLYFEEADGWESEGVVKLLMDRQIENLGWPLRRLGNGRH